MAQASTGGSGAGGGAAGGGYAILGALGGGLIGLGSSAMQHQAAKKMQKRAQDWQLKMALERYPIEIASLEKAGLNPMLALGGAGPGISGASPAPQVAMPDIAGAAAKGASTAKLAHMIRSQGRQAAATADSAETQAWYDRETLSSAMETAWSQRDITLANERTAVSNAKAAEAQARIHEATLPMVESMAALYRKHGRELTAAREISEIIGNFLNFGFGAGIHRGKSETILRKGPFKKGKR